MKETKQGHKKIRPRCAVTDKEKDREITMIMNKKGIIIAALLMCFVLLLSACSVAEKLEEYSFGADKVSSINAVIGEKREITYVNTETKNGLGHKEYTYKSASVAADLSEYTAYLLDSGWIVTQDYDLTADSGWAQFSKEAANKGRILVMSISFSESSYVIRINKLMGKLPA